MRFSHSLLVAAGAVAVLAAPIKEEAFDPYDECENEDFTSSIAVQTSASSVSAAVTASAPAVTSSAEAGVTSSASTMEPVPTSSTIAVTSSASFTSSAPSSTGTGALEFLGINESGAEFGNNKIPGVLGTDYTWPDTASIKTLMDKGMNIFRIPFLMERLAPGTMTAPLNATYLAALKTTVEFITAAGGHAIVDPHNFGRYDGTVFTSTSDFKTFWTNVATEFATNDNVVFDCNNEFHDEPSNTLVADLNQACIDGVRAAGATTQYIFVEGTVSSYIHALHEHITNLHLVIHWSMDMDFFRQRRRHGRPH